VTFGIETDEGKALLASANGAAFAYFLIQRKVELGHKTITDVTIFESEPDANYIVEPNLLFRVADVPPVKRDPRDGRAKSLTQSRVSDVKGQAL
jgi:hypothetical protein